MRFVRLIMWRRDPVSQADSIHDVLEAIESSGKTATIFNREDVPEFDCDVELLQDEADGSSSLVGKLKLVRGIPLRCKVEQICIKDGEQLIKLDRLDKWLGGQFKFSFEKGGV